MKKNTKNHSKILMKLEINKHFPASAAHSPSKNLPKYGKNSLRRSFKNGSTKLSHQEMIGIINSDSATNCKNKRTFEINAEQLNSNKQRNSKQGNEIINSHSTYNDKRNNLN